MNNKKLCSNCGTNKAESNHLTGHLYCHICQKGPLCFKCYKDFLAYECGHVKNDEQ